MLNAVKFGFVKEAYYASQDAGGAVASAERIASSKADVKLSCKTKPTERHKLLVVTTRSSCFLASLYNKIARLIPQRLHSRVCHLT